jgi:hypothetical protein
LGVAIETKKSLELACHMQTNLGWVFDFCNTCWFWVFENVQNQRIVGFRYLKISESKNY